MFVAKFIVFFELVLLCLKQLCPYFFDVSTMVLFEFFFFSKNLSFLMFLVVC